MDRLCRLLQLPAHRVGDERLTETQAGAAMRAPQGMPRASTQAPTGTIEEKALPV